MTPSPSSDPATSSMAERMRVVYPSLSWICARPHRLIAFGFGSGLLRPMSGTWGTLLAWLMWIAVEDWLPSDLYVGLFLALAFTYGCWACLKVCRELDTPDHLGMVWDEMIAMWLVLWLTPSDWISQIAAFVLFRVFDILKPQPIKYCDAHVKGGLGVMVDDILAACYALLVIAAAVRLGVLG